MADWDDLERELDAWRRTDRPATLWWRDDDAVAVTPELERLLALSDDHRLPVAIAVIPRDAEPALAARLAGHGGAAVMQHGFAHVNHAPGQIKKAEFGPHRAPDAMLDELLEGRDRLAGFDGLLPALAPPWNRIDLHLFADLPGIGIEAVSTYGPRKSANPAPGLRQTNTHVDPIEWTGSRGFVGDGAALDLVVAHLAARREGRADADEPTGLLSHHRAADEAGWRFLDALFRRTADHPAARWIDAWEAFWP